MKIARLLDTAGQTHFGSPINDGRARRLVGDLYAGLTETDEVISVARWLAPVRPVNIFCIGLNYRAHAGETGKAIPTSPVVFMKPTTAISNPGDPIPLPRACDQGPEVDYEAELAVVIGRTARDVPASRALGYVLGYTCANDVSARHWQLKLGGGQWIRGKGFDGFCPLGPWLVTADAIPDPQTLGITCTLNGERVQDGHTGQMLFTVAELIAFLSRDTTLLPGTLILTGTPSGVGMARQPPLYLRDGDRVAVAIERIGTLSNPVRQAEG